MSALLALLVLSQPVSAGAQLTLGAGAILAMALLWALLPRRRWSRMLFLAFGSLVVVRYLVWRVTSTLPPVTDPLGFGLGSLLLAAELYCVLILAISLVINADPLERAAAPLPGDDDLPTVDVFIPTYNEDAYILATTVAAARALDYPAAKLVVWLLDDGGTDQKCADRDPAKAEAARSRRASLQQLCAELGANYLTRRRNEHAKAGNLNNGLRASRGAIVVVLDADHAPFRSFLRETIGHFAADPKLFLVQTPHVFLNPDPVEKNLRTFERMPSENEMFYAVTQRGLDKWNGSFFCGSAALLRREALESTGGFSGITITEDCETAFELHARGWTSVYVDKPLIAGLQPETFDAFIGQRSRWCQGMFQIMLLKNPALRRGLKPIQRLAYLSSMTFWFFPLPRLAFMLAPLLHIFLDVKIFVSSIDEALAYTASYVVANLMLQNYLYGRVRWPWVSELYEYVQGVYLAKAIVSVVASPRKPTFNVTAKGLTLEDEHLSLLATPFLVIFALLLAGVVTAAFRYAFEPGVTSLMLVVGLWCLFNLVIAGAALGAVAERPPAERIPGLDVRREGVLRVGDGVTPVRIERASAAGCTLRPSEGTLPTGADGPLRGTLAVASVSGRPLPELPVVVAAADGTGAVNVAFTGLRPGDYAAVADLMYGDAGAIAGFLAKRRGHKDVLTGTITFMAWGAAGPLRALRYAWKARGRTTAAPAVAPVEPAIVAAPGVPSNEAVLAASAAPVAVETVSAGPPLLVEALSAERTHEGGSATASPNPAPAPVRDDADAVLPAAWLVGMVALARAEIAVAERAPRQPALPPVTARGWEAMVLHLTAPSGVPGGGARRSAERAQSRRAA